MLLQLIAVPPSLVVVNCESWDISLTVITFVCLSSRNFTNTEQFLVHVPSMSPFLRRSRAWRKIEAFFEVKWSLRYTLFWRKPFRLSAAFRMTRTFDLRLTNRITIKGGLALFFGFRVWQAETSSGATFIFIVSRKSITCDSRDCCSPLGAFSFDSAEPWLDTARA